MRVWQLLYRIERGVLVWTILGLALVGCAQVFTRYVLNISFTWYEELGRYLGVLVAFLGAATGVKSSSHFAMDLFVRRMRHPWQQLLRLCTASLCVCFCLLVTWYSFKLVGRIYGYGTTSPAIGMPMYLAYLPIPLCTLLMAIRFGEVLLAAWHEWRTGGNDGEER